MAMDMGVLYAVVAAVAASVNILLYVRTKETKYKETIDRPFCFLLAFFALFAVEDATWGVFMSTVIETGRTGYVIFTYGFHLFAALSAFFWAGYTAEYFGKTGTAVKVVHFLRTLLLITQLAIIGTNLFTGKFFVIDESSVYHTGPLRTVNFVIQMSYYVVLLVYGGVLLALRRGGEQRTRIGFTVIFFSVIPLLFGFGQLKFPDAPMYSLGFMMSAVFIYTTTVTKQREIYMEQSFEDERSRLKMEAIEKAAEAKTRFLFNMSHDIRTPMNAIVGFTNLAKKNVGNTEYLSQCLEKVGLSAEHLLSLINQILDMSRIESGKVEISRVPGDLLADQKKLVTIVEQLGKEKNVHFEYHTVNVRNHYLQYDSLHLDQVLMNILSNSFKYTPSGGSVFYTIEQLNLTEEGRCAYRFMVSDNGVGMTPEFLEHIFDEFEREKTATASGIEGTGLGMSIVKQLTDLMHGTITVESEKGRGTTTTLCFTFDVCDPDEVRTEDKDGEADYSFLAGKRILLVDDNALNLEIACDLFEEYGLKVDTATDGTKAVEILTKAEPDAYDYVFMDVQMPFMNGYDATRAIRTLDKEWTKKVPIFAMTANAFEEDRKDALAAGMDAHLSKPIQMEAVLKTMAKFR